MLARKWVRHLFFWTMWLLAMTVYFTGPEYSKIIKILLHMLAGMPVFLIYSYLSLYVIIPVGFNSERFLLLILYFIFGGIIFSVIYQISINYFYYRVFEPQSLLMLNSMDFKVIANNIVNINLAFLMFGSAKFIRDYLMELKMKNEIESKNIEAEISFLATQLHPHFLFNTLNNLYSLSISDSPKTAISLQKIKGLMKYILYECGQPEIILFKEISLIGDYLELEKLRYDNRLRVSFENNVQNINLLIAPMILFTFVENCFKHGSSKSAGSSYINISLSTEGNNLIFIAENSFPSLTVNDKNERKGLGLENAKKRLSFLYPGQHTLGISHERNCFRVELKIENLETLNKNHGDMEGTEEHRVL